VGPNLGKQCDMSVLITGGAGFAGSHMVLSLCDAGHDVDVLKNLQKAAGSQVRQ